MPSDSSAYSYAEWIDGSNMWILLISLMESNESERTLRAPLMAFISASLEIASPPDLKFSM